MHPERLELVADRALDHVNRPLLEERVGGRAAAETRCDRFQQYLR
jgi:hypothetical protein